jgi:DNA-binding MarR family transcriptional regulator
MSAPSQLEVLIAISDKKSLEIFSSIAEGTGKSNTMLKQIKGLSRKQYYSRTALMLKTDLIKRRRGYFSLTTLGIIVYHAELEIDSAVRNHWKLKAIDSIQALEEMDKEERAQLIKTIIGDEKIGNIIQNQLEASSKK